ncbi:MAG: hypothetical protein ACRDPC_02110 [Solirubrobacteraceae bacterium]
MPQRAPRAPAAPRSADGDREVSASTLPAAADLLGAHDPNARARVALAVQRTAGNAALGGLLLRNGPAPAGPVAPPAPAPPSPTSFADRATLVTTMTGTPTETDLLGACRYMAGESIDEILSIGRELLAAKPAVVQSLENAANRTPGIIRERIAVAMAAVRLKGQMARLGFEDQYTREIVLLERNMPYEVPKVLGELGREVPELVEMKKCKGFLALTDEERSRLAFLVAGSTSLSATAAAAMRKVLDDPAADKDDAATFRKFIADEQYLARHVSLPGAKRLPRDKFTVKAPVDVAKHPYYSGEAAAKRHDVEIEGVDTTGAAAKLTIPVFEPKVGPTEAGVGLPTVTEVAEVLAETPHVSRSKITRVDLNPARSPDDEKWKRDPRYNPGGGDFRTYMSAGAVGVVSIYPAASPHDQLLMSSAMVHETGHTASRAAWGNPHDKANKRWDPWRNAMTSDGMALSKYGKSSESEDFAESWALWAPNVGKPREAEIRALIPARCKLMQTLINQAPGPQPP